MPLEILAPKKIHTRKNPDPNPPEVAFEPKKRLGKFRKNHLKYIQFPYKEHFPC
jgi:hypothetical protein